MSVRQSIGFVLCFGGYVLGIVVLHEAFETDNITLAVVASVVTLLNAAAMIVMFARALK